MVLAFVLPVWLAVNPTFVQSIDLTCRDDSRLEDVWILDGFNQSARQAIIHLGNDGEITSWNDRQIIWQVDFLPRFVGLKAYVFSLESMALQLAIIDELAVSVTTFNCEFGLA